MKYIKIVISTLFILLILTATAFHIFSKPKSSKKILGTVGSDYIVTHKEFKGLKYRYLAPLDFDKNKPTLLFIHGAIGSLLDFKSLITDFEMKEKYNMISFDRPNYGDIYDKNYIHKISFESEIVLDLLNEYDSDVENILVGYSYGGPIAGLAQFDERISKTVLVAPAVDPESEVVPFLISFYKNKYTRFLVPGVWQEASKEKLKHVDDLKELKKIWELIDKPIIHIQGVDDSLVPYVGTSKFLQKNIKEEFYLHIPVSGKGHGFVFSEKEVFTDYFLK